VVMQYLTQPDGSIPPGVDVAALEAAGVLIVRPVEVPRAPGMISVEGEPEQRDGEWWQTWQMVPAPPPEPEPVPASVTPLQIRRALRQVGLNDEVAAFVEASSPEVREAWEYAVQIDRNNELIAAAAASIGATDAEVDDLFRLAATL
jgi:hypothetical protein